LIVVAIEWLTSRDSFVVARETRATAHPIVEADTVGADEGEAAGWTAFEEAQEQSDAMTMIGAPPAEEPLVIEAEAVSEPEQVTSPAAEEQEEASQEEEQPRRRWWRRHEDDVSADAEGPAVAEPPRH